MAKAVLIELDRPRRLRFDVNALSDAEEALGVGLGVALNEAVGIRTLRALLWAGLKWEDRGLTLQRAGILLQERMEAGHGTEEIAAKISEAITASGLFGTDGDQGNVTGAGATGDSANG